jgi:hypothetical protein
MMDSVIARYSIITFLQQCDDDVIITI